MKRRNFFLPDNLWDALIEQARKEQIPASELIRRILMSFFKLNERG